MIIQLQKKIGQGIVTVLLPCLLLMPINVYSAPESIKPRFDYFSGIGSLFIVLAVIFILAFLLKKTRLINQGQGYMKVVASLTLGNKEKIMVIEIGAKQLLVGVTAGQINLLTELEAPLTIDEPSKASFSTQLSALIGKHGK